MSSKDDGMLTNVDLEGLGRPTPNVLDHVWRNPSFSESSSATGTQRMAANVPRKVSTEPLEKPRACRDGPIFFEPKLCSKRETLVTESEIPRKRTPSIVVELSRLN
jgi:hypothetical protein